MASIIPSYDREGERIGWQVAVRKKGFPAQYKTFRTRKEAEGWATITESEMVREVWRDRSEAESTTLKECLERYAQDIIPTKNGDGRRERGFARQWQARPIACCFMASIDGQDVSASIKEMESEGKAANTIRLHLALLSHLFEVAHKEWRMASLINPVELVRKPKLPQGLDRRLVDDEESRPLSTCQSINPELASIVRFACGRESTPGMFRAGHIPVTVTDQ
ncbi:hypothetical protein A6M27_19690 [Acidithiobacillus thiooxidans]|uniref:Core-binding (CB) domain-containing protein n=1 Tax=Acidithiobacillus thiooxidans TaxID=930 RepID=A0A1C2IYZ4_ACITH|nr:hypothetical protein [Acidithiobacillus thiooxidans]OCX73106.1 hypothetical protein A6O24_12385 [Acidithiobacillus thiooxidans]OCX75845.1 hypothetical protein A6P07_03940 [Acidithiobacillus thiooxidans]OCX76345.1 hypothetical protein A6M23_00470 [Acidithiobacillus thiooxidans]OCX77941.1 hypothetical protein A6O26_18875 [Acidithiobacillus thiooxidans]OCX79598.1 hypothetical protein A6P08_17630 [Acidithiobacillus thiooxidans]